MTISADNGLVFDDTDSRCDFSMLRITANLKIGFVQCYDESSGMIKRYCGLYEECNKEQTIEEIMLRGAKFDDTVNYWKDRI